MYFKTEPVFVRIRCHQQQSDEIEQSVTSRHRSNTADVTFEEKEDNAHDEAKQ